MNKIACNSCGREFQITRDTLTEEHDTIHGYAVQITNLSCPHCGKRYPVIVDDAETLSILSELKTVLSRMAKYRTKGRPAPQKLQDKYTRLNKMLDFKREKLADKIGNSLDYFYHRR